MLKLTAATKRLLIYKGMRKDNGFLSSSASIVLKLRLCR